QVSLEIFSAERRSVQVGEGYVHTGHRIDDIVQHLCIAGLIGPGLKMHDLGSADTEHDSQDFRTGYALRQFWVEAAAALLDGRKVKAGCVADGLKEVHRFKVFVGPGNCRVLPNCQGRNCLRERVPEIGVSSAAAIPSPPSRVHGELHQVGETSDLLGAGSLAAWQGTKRIETDRLRAF